mgnify:CR=1 FL=1
MVPIVGPAVVRDGGRDSGRENARAQQSAVQVRKRNAPADGDQRRIFYYKKQIDAHTPMVIVLLDGEEIEGTIEWYDRGALKVNRKSAASTSSFSSETSSTCLRPKIALPKLRE